jgi:hypothetical protein
MKKLYTLSLLFTGLLSFGQAQDAFTATGALTDNGWAHHSGATTGQLITSAGSLSYPGFTTAGNRVSLVAGNTEDVNLASAAALTGVVYYSAILNVTNATGLNLNTSTGDYFLMTAATAGATGVTAFSGRTYVKAGNAADTFNLGVLNNSGGTAAPTYIATDYPVNVPLFIVVKYDLTSNTASLFVNPALSGAEGSPNVTNATGTTAAPAQIAAIAIRQGGTAAAGTGNVDIDELRLNGTWAAVTSPVLANKQFAIAGLKVYPNPVTNGNLFITSDNNEVKQVVVFDVLGKQVLKATVTDQPLNVANLNSGVYMVKITEEGKTATRKLVIK